MTAPTAFEQAFGFPRKAVTLANWRTNPYSRWAFQNVGELVPSAGIETCLAATPETPQVGDELLRNPAGTSAASETVEAFLRRSHTDALTVMKGGRFVADWSASHMTFGTRHIVFSISKSLTALLAGILAGEGLLDPDAPVTHYVPEIAGSAYGDATVRHVLDMVVAVDIEESYLDPDSAYGRYRKATLWNPGGGSESMLAFLANIPRLKEPHGAVFRYRSPNSDLLGIVVERAGGRRIPDLMREKLWRPLGARSNAAITVDMEGTARTAGGVSTTARDLARVGEMMRQGGVMDGRRIVPEAWVRDTVAAGGDTAAWQRGDMAFLFPKGRYRNKWYQMGDGAYCGIGIHGQWLFVEPQSDVVIVKMSSQPEPVDDALDQDCVAFFRHMAKLCASA
jgi:hypothetical protein